MNKHRSYLSIHIYTFRYDCCVHCNWHHFFLLFFFFCVDRQSELTDVEMSGPLSFIICQ